MNNQKLISDFIDLAVAHSDAQFKNQPLRKNKTGNGLYKIWLRAKKDKAMAHVLIDALMCNSDPNVRIWICSIALDIGYRTWDAERALDEVSKLPDVGLLGRNASVILESWKENVKPKGSDLI